jgi:SAM-dependent methyltransferase
MIDSQTLEWLLSEEGRAALNLTSHLQPNEASRLATLQTLQKQFNTDHSRALLEMMLLRKRAITKFSKANEMFFDREALEMASSEQVANYRASQLLQFATVMDLGCGIGGDTIALSRAGLNVRSIDKERSRCRMTQVNLHVNNQVAEVICADFMTTEFGRSDVVFVDPSRRSGNHRSLDPEQYFPPLNAIIAKYSKTPVLLVKVAPGIHRRDLAALGASYEFIYSQGELKECVLWFDRENQHKFARAVIFPGRHIYDALPVPEESEARPIQRYLYEPNPAIIRADLVENLARDLSLSRISAGMALLSSDVRVESAFLSSYRVDAVLPLDERRINEYLHTRQVVRVTITKHGTSAEYLFKKGKNTDTERLHKFVILTKEQERTVAVIADRIDES